MTAGDVLLAGGRDFGARWKDLVLAAALPVLPVTIIGVVAVATVTPQVVVDMLANRLAPAELEASFRAVRTSEWVRFGVAYGAFTVVSGIANSVALGACLIVERERLAERALTVRAALRGGLRRVPSVWWMYLLSFIPIGLGLLLCLLPGLWLVVSWWVAPVALFHEDVRGRRALGRSYRLVRSAFWFAALVVLLEFVALGVIQSAATSLLPMLLPEAALPELSFVVMMLASTAAGLFTLGLHVCIATRLYLELVARSSPLPVATAA